MSKVAFVQLARAGDIVNVLPIMRHKARQGHEVCCYVLPKFADVLEPCSYVTPILRDSHHRDVPTTTKLAGESKQFDEVYATQVDSNEEPPPIDCENFTMQSWARAGRECIDLYHELPLIFDRRDAAGEAAAVEKYMPKRTGKPLLVFALSGHSSANPHAEAFAKFVRDGFSYNYDILDLDTVGEPDWQGKHRLPKVHHLLPFIGSADILIANDSLPLHLSYAFGTPTIALHADKNPWYWSEPRYHWIHRATHAAANSPEGRHAIACILDRRDFVPGRLARRPELTVKERIHHVVDWYCPSDPANADRHRVLNARRTWDETVTREHNKWVMVWHETDRHAKRTSRDMGDSRKLPFIRDLFDFAVERLRDDEIVCFTNSDVCLTPEAPDEIRRKLQTGECCYSRRVDLGNTDAPTLKRDEIARVRAHVGADLFACRAGFWRKHREEFPDLIYACEGWDWVARQIFKRYNPAAEISPPVIYHKAHASYWSWTVNIVANPAQVHNRNLCEQWARANGCAGAIQDVPDKYLFKPDGTW